MKKSDNVLAYGFVLLRKISLHSFTNLIPSNNAFIIQRSLIFELLILSPEVHAVRQSCADSLAW
jgi:hypothetical protein